jgi:hypothetical protein
VTAHGEKSIADAFHEGLFWRALGRSALDNPYSPDSLNYAFWLEGWSLIDELEDHVVSYGARALRDPDRGWRDDRK